MRLTGHSQTETVPLGEFPNLVAAKAASKAHGFPLYVLWRDGVPADTFSNSHAPGVFPMTIRAFGPNIYDEVAETVADIRRIVGFITEPIIKINKDNYFIDIEAIQFGQRISIQLSGCGQAMMAYSVFCMATRVPLKYHHTTRLAVTAQGEFSEDFLHKLTKLVEDESNVNAIRIGANDNADGSSVEGTECLEEEA